MPTVVYSKEGVKTYFEFDVDARDAILHAGYTATPPSGQKEQSDEKLTGEESEKLADVYERARLGGAITPEERELLNKRPSRDPRLGEKGEVHEVGSYPEGEHPGALGGASMSPGSVPGSPPGGTGGAVANAGSPGRPVTSEDARGVQSQEKADSFDPATADRSALFDYLRNQGEEPENATSTGNLRQRVYEKMGVQKRS